MEVQVLSVNSLFKLWELESGLKIFHFVLVRKIQFEGFCGT